VTTVRVLLAGFLVIGLPCWSVNTLTVQPGSAQTPSSPTVALDVVRYPALTNLIRNQRGKVLVVDVWGEF
jgi:hypothetical protein